MTIDEAIKMLTQDDYGNCDCGDWCRAYDMAIRSLELWTKIKEEIKDLDLGFIDKEYQAGVAYGIMKIKKIIDKHLKEIENRN